MGGNDAYNVDKERPFFWWATGQKFTFTNWGYHEPNNVGSKEHCVHITASSLYEWNDIVCEGKMGFICEDDPYIETSKMLKPMSNAFDMISDEIYLKFKRLPMFNVNELNTRLQALEEMAKEEKSETQELQNITKSFVQKLSYQQQLTAKNLWENLQNQGHKLNERIEQSMQQFNGKFDEKFNVK